MDLSRKLLDTWYAPQRTWLAWALSPLALLYAIVVAARASLYRHGLIKHHALPVPVIVVGNITVGGTGKTPFVIALARALTARGFRPGIISRGYGGQASARGDVVLVTTDSAPLEVGDEAAQVARAGLPMAIGRDRVAAGHALLKGHPDVDVVIADDGLQHYRLARTVEIALLDGARQLGNALPLPSGPLREPPWRLAQVDAVVLTSIDDAAWRMPVFRYFHGVPAFRQTLMAGALRQVADPQQTREAAFFAQQEGVHAVAGIGHPERFFAMLRRLGIEAVPHAFGDHHRFTAEELTLPEARWVLMTEKDAVKCTGFADARCWYLPVESPIAPPLVQLIEEKLRGHPKND